MISDQSISDYDRLLRGSPSHVASLDIIQNVGANGLGVFPNSPQPNEVSTYIMHAYIKFADKFRFLGYLNSL